MAHPAPDPDDACDDLAAELDGLTAILAEALGLVPRGGGPDRVRLVERLQAARDAVRHAAVVVSAQLVAAPPSPESLAEWLHDLRARVGTIAGWIRFLAQQRDEATWLRTADILERNAKLLADLLAHPPG